MEIINSTKNLNFRYLSNENILNFDNDLIILLNAKLIQLGLLTNKAKLYLLKKYNLDNILLKETLEDLLNNKLGNALYSDVNTAINNLKQFKNGGNILKCSIGSAIKKFIGNNLDDVAEKAISEVGDDIVPKILKASGTTEVISKEAMTHLRKVANSTNDKRVKILADFTEICYEKKIKLPEEFNSFIDSIFKLPVVKQIDTKVVTTGKKIVADPELISWHGLTLQRPTFEKVKKTTQTIHTGNFRDVVKYTRKVPNAEELQKVSPQIDEAITALRSMMEGNDFKLTESMMDEIYLKSNGTVQHFKDAKEHSAAFRKMFKRIEYPKIIEDLVNSKLFDLSSLTAQEAKNFKYYEAHKWNQAWLKKTRNIVQDFVDNSPLYKGEKGEVLITPVIIRPKQKQLGIFGTKEEQLLLPKAFITKQDAPFVKGYLFTVNGKPILGKIKIENNGVVQTLDLENIPVSMFHEHHSTSLSELMAKAYIKNPEAPSVFSLLRTYNKNKPLNYYHNFMLLEPAEHQALHDSLKYSLDDFKRIKALSRSGRFETMDDLMYYYDRLKSSQLQNLRS